MNTLHRYLVGCPGGVVQKMTIVIQKIKMLYYLCPVVLVPVQGTEVIDRKVVSNERLSVKGGFFCWPPAVCQRMETVST